MENRTVILEVIIPKERWAPGIWAGSEGAVLTEEQFKAWTKSASPELLPELIDGREEDGFIRGED